MDIACLSSSRLTKRVPCRRRHDTPRNASQRFATIDFDEGRVDCRVRNLSDKRATIKISLAVNLPLEFEIAIHGERERRYCAIASRRKHCTYVYFV